MDPAAIAMALMSAQAGQTQMAVAAKMIKMNLNSDAQVAQLLDASNASLNQLSNVGAGIGGNLDISA